MRNNSSVSRALQIRSNQNYKVHSYAANLALAVCCALLISVKAHAGDLDSNQVCTDDYQMTGNVELITAFGVMDTAEAQAQFQTSFEESFPRNVPSDRTKKAIPGLISVTPLEYVPNAYVFKFNPSVRQMKIYEPTNLIKKLWELITGRPNLTKKIESSLKGRAKVRKEKYFPVKVQVEPSYLLHASAAPNDERYPPCSSGDSSCMPSDRQWNLGNVSGIKVESAWEKVASLADSQPQSIVAILDTGISDTTSELDVSQFATKTFIDNQTGSDVSFHGTGIASIISSKTNNEIGMAGISWGGRDDGVNLVKILPVKIMETSARIEFSEAVGCTHDLLDALAYSVDPGKQVDRSYFNILLSDAGEIIQPDKPALSEVPENSASIINLSVQIENDSKFLHQELVDLQQYFPKTLLVVGPDNEIEQLSRVPAQGETVAGELNYPSSYGLSNVIVVSATTASMCIWETYGTDSIDILAPGEEINALTPQGSISRYHSGNSYAVPHVVGAAALLKRMAKDWEYRELKEYLIKSTSRRMCADNALLRATPGECISYPSICDPTKIATGRGLLDVDAATAPPLDFVELKDTTVWNVSDAPVQVTLVQTFDPEVEKNGSTIKLCGKVNAELQLFRNGSTSNVPYKTVSLTQIDRSTLSTGSPQSVEVPSLIAFHPVGPAENMASGRLRLQCSDSELFRMSALFKVQFPPVEQPLTPSPPVISVTEARWSPPYSSALRDEAQLLR